MAKVWILYKEAVVEKNGPKMLEFAKLHDLNAEVFIIEKFSVDSNMLYYDNHLIVDLPKVVLIRGNQSELLTFLTNNNVRVINSKKTIILCKDKWKAYNVVCKLNILQPKTILFEGENYEYYRNIFGDAFIIKNRFGQSGDGVYKISNQQEYEELCKIVKYKNNYIVQQFIKNSKGKDLRSYVIGGEIVGYVLRQNDNDFRANTAQGGNATKVLLEEMIKNKKARENFQKNVLRIAKALDGEIVGVDFLFGENAMIFCEINTNSDFLSMSASLLREKMILYIKKVLNEVNNKTTK